MFCILFDTKVKMNAYDVNVFSDDEEDLAPHILARPKIIRPRTNFWEEYDQKDFFDRFRLSPRTVEMITEEISDLIKHPTDR